MNADSSNFVGRKLSKNVGRITHNTKQVPNKFSDCSQIGENNVKNIQHKPILDVNILPSTDFSFDFKLLMRDTKSAQPINYDGQLRVLYRHEQVISDSDLQYQLVMNLKNHDRWKREHLPGRLGK